MVKLTIVGRVRDALPLAQGHRYMNNDNNNTFTYYKQQGEFILKEASVGALVSPKMTISMDHHCFYCLLQDDICYIVLCDSSYPRKLAFRYLQDLHMEFNKFDRELIEKISRPYSFVKFDSIIGNVRKQYVDTRTQANLAKLNANPHSKELDDNVTEHISQILKRRRDSEILNRMSATTDEISPIWSSPLLQVIALRWTPISIIIMVAIILLWARLNLTECYI